MDQPPPPSSWAFASPDGNVLLVGALAVPTTGPLVDGAQFELAPGGLYIVSLPSSVSAEVQCERCLRELQWAAGGPGHGNVGLGIAVQVWESRCWALGLAGMMGEQTELGASDEHPRPTS